MSLPPKVNPSTVSSDMARFMDMLKQVDQALKNMDGKSVKRIMGQLVAQKIREKLAHSDYKAFPHYKVVADSWTNMDTNAKSMMPKLDAWNDIQSKFPRFKAVREELEKHVSTGRVDGIASRALEAFKKQNDYVCSTYGKNNEFSSWGPIGYCMTKGVELISKAEALIVQKDQQAADAESEKKKKLEDAQREKEQKMHEKEEARKAEFAAQQKADVDRDAAIAQENEERKAAKAQVAQPPNPNAGKIFLSKTNEEFPGLMGGEQPDFETGNEIHALAMLERCIDELVPEGDWIHMWINITNEHFSFKHAFKEERERIGGGGPAMALDLVYDPMAEGAATTQQNSGGFASGLANLPEGEHIIMLEFGLRASVLASASFKFTSIPSKKSVYEKWAPVVNSKRASMYEDEKKEREEAEREAFAPTKFDDEIWVTIYPAKPGNVWLKIGRHHLMANKRNGPDRRALPKGASVFYSDGTGIEGRLITVLPHSEEMEGVLSV